MVHANNVTTAMNHAQDSSSGIDPHLLERANTGDVGAQYEMWGLLSMSAKDTKDQIAAEAWLKKSAEQGFAEAEFEYGKCFDDEDGFPYESVRWYRKAAAKGHVEAQYELGLCYALRYCGTDFEAVDDEDRIRLTLDWITKAAQQGHPGAQLTLGEIYLNAIDGLSTGNMVDYQEASTWLHRSAEQGIVDAQVRLSCLYAEGHGVPQNFVEAYYWLNIAAALRHVDKIVSKRDESATRLTKDKLIATQIRATEWFDIHRSGR